MAMSRCTTSTGDRCAGDPAQPRRNRRGVRLAAAVALLSIVLAAGAGVGGAQTGPTAGFVRVDARITGDGPWTAWLGGAAERTVIVTIENTSPQTLRDAVIEIRLDSGADPVVEPLPLPDLPPGERTTVDLSFTIPRFAIGTHGIEGTVTGADTPIPFRTETTHIPWLLLLLPTLVLAQLALVSLRDRARRRLHAPRRVATAPAPTTGADRHGDRPIDLTDEPAPAGIAECIEAELDEALAELDRWRLDDDRFLLAVQQRARTVTRRVSDRFSIPASAMPELAASIKRALLERAASPRRVSA
ncbi:MAG: hypothetical protein AAGA90_03280 [Actinomycetota bacterium]